jgi:hypothetical protein
MKSRKKSNKVSKSAKTRLSDLTPKKDARGGAVPTPPAVFPKKKPALSSSIRASGTARAVNA